MTRLPRPLRIALAVLAAAALAVAGATVAIVLPLGSAGAASLTTTDEETTTTDEETRPTDEETTTTGDTETHTTTAETAPPGTSADLSLIKTASASTILRGRNVTFTVTVKNNGPGTASGVTVSDPLPAGVTLVSATPSQGSCPGTVTCSLGDLAVGAEAKVTIVVTAASTGTIANTATVTATSADPVPANNTGSVSVTVQAPDVAITATSSPQFVAAGRRLAVVLTVRNNGPGTATGVVVSNPLAMNTQLVGATASQGSCTGAVTCNLGALGQGAEAMISIGLLARGAGTIRNMAMVSSSGDPNSANDTATTGALASPITGDATGKVSVNGKPFRAGAIPNGARVEAIQGVVTLHTDEGDLQVTGSGLPGLFTVHNGEPATELRLAGGNFGVCGRGLRTTSSRAATPKPKKTVVRRLFAKGKGTFRTRGSYASATVRGTGWLFADRCDGTFTSVSEGSMTVADFPKKKTVLVGNGKNYLAAKP